MTGHTLEYKNYVGAVVYDDSVGCLHARVINSGSYPVATAEAGDFQALQREFELSVDTYLAFCAEQGLQPVSPMPLTPDLQPQGTHKP